jgi:hypothetical protein
MAKRRYTSEEIIYKLREDEVLLGQGKTISEACKTIGVLSVRLPRSARGVEWAIDVKVSWSVLL